MKVSFQITQNPDGRYEVTSPEIPGLSMMAKSHSQAKAEVTILAAQCRFIQRRHQMRLKQEINHVR